jgi:RNA polymerase sigma-70 factor (ECF subfamily)
MNALPSNILLLPPAESRHDEVRSDAETSRLDADAMRRLCHGEIGALGEIYDRHHLGVRRFVVRTTGSTHDADDLVHTIFLTVAKIAPNFDPSRSCRAWLLGIAVRVTKRHRTANARWSRALSRLEQVVPFSSIDPERAIDARAELLRIEKALAGMNEKDRVALVMVDLEGLRCDEVAAALDVPIGTVWRRIHDARRKLLALLSEGP